MNSTIMRLNGEFFGHDWSNGKFTLNDEVTLRMVYNYTAPHYTCLRPPGAAGALLVPDKYNGWDYNSVLLGCAEPPIGHTCKELDECEMENGHCVRTVHAEVNTILMAAKFGIATLDATIYSLLRPCYQCTKAIITAGIKRIVFAGEAYNEERTRNLLISAGVRFDYVDIDLPYGNAS